MHMLALTAQLLAAAGLSLLLFIVVPLTLARLQGVRLKEGFQLHRASPPVIVAAITLGATLWPLAYDSIILCQNLGIATISAEKLAEHRPAFLSLVERMRAAPPWLVLFSLAVVPAIGEELFFRGYLLGALRGKLPAWQAIVLTGAIFGLFHASVGGLITVERIVSSTFLGLMLGWICWRTASVIPGMLLHMLHNGLMVSLIYFGPQLQKWGWDIDGQRYLPLPLVAATTLVAIIALCVMTWTGRQSAASSSSVTAEIAGTTRADDAVKVPSN
jgi:ABC-2 type transport system permease protein/sodium transport system permease protein